MADKKRLVLLLDGTWNSDEGEHLTNIVHLRQMIEAANRIKHDEANKEERPKGKQRVTQRIYYDAGVGATSQRFSGGIFGFGLSDNVKQAYRFLSQFYAPGDEIFIFGFSRGAYTARSVAGFVAASGLLRAECCDHANFQRAWDYYRTPVRDRMPAEKSALEKLCTPGVRVRFLGVFDTVGALGVPVGGPLRAIGASRFRFHDTKLGSSIDYAFHALSIDEHRGPFVPSLWVLPDHNGNVAVEQVWFAGVHSDIGGGYPFDTRHAPKVSASDMALHWMLDKAMAAGLDVVAEPLPEKLPLIAEIHDSLGWYALSRRRPMHRLINRAPAPEGTRVWALNPPAVPMNEKVHFSALTLFGEEVVIGGLTTAYRPVNLEAAFAAIETGVLPVVGPNGNHLDVVDAAGMVDAARSRAGIPRAR